MNWFWWLFGGGGEPAEPGAPLCATAGATPLLTATAGAAALVTATAGATPVLTATASAEVC